MSLTLGINNTAAKSAIDAGRHALERSVYAAWQRSLCRCDGSTIASVANFINGQAYSLGGVDYGAMSSSLFCFDNLCVPNLREEELALLRGRSDHTGPIDAVFAHLQPV